MFIFQKLEWKQLSLKAYYYKNCRMWNLNVCIKSVLTFNINVPNLNQDQN